MSDAPATVWVLMVESGWFENPEITVDVFATKEAAEAEREVMRQRGHHSTVFTRKVKQ